MLSLSNTVDGSPIFYWGGYEAYGGPFYHSSGGGTDGKLAYVSFDTDSQQYIDLGPLTMSIMRKGGFTLVTHMAFTGASGNKYEMIFGFGENGEYLQNILLARPTASDALCLDIYDVDIYDVPTMPVYLCVDDAIQQEQWSTYVVRYSSKTLKVELIKNGQTLGTQVISTPLADRTLSRCYIGKSNWQEDVYLNGNVAGVYVFDRFLSNDELLNVTSKFVPASEFPEPSSLPTSFPSCYPSSHPSQAPSVQPTQNPSSQPSRQPTRQPSSQPSRNPSSQPSRQPTRQPSSQPSRAPTSQPSKSPLRPSISFQAIPTPKPTREPSLTAYPTSSPKETSEPSSLPTSFPSCYPSSRPSQAPSAQPTTPPLGYPTGKPSGQPSTGPSGKPSSQPSMLPSIKPSSQPTKNPSSQPSRLPTNKPSSQPSRNPSSQPSSLPTNKPSSQPSRKPSSQPSRNPTRQPSSQPSINPSSQPSRQPTRQPSSQPSRNPSSQPSRQPTRQPSSQPSRNPSSQPSRQPTRQPSSQPSRAPTSQPSISPVRPPTGQPSSSPTGQPSSVPSTPPPTSQPTQSPTSPPSTSLNSYQAISVSQSISAPGLTSDLVKINATIQRTLRSALVKVVQEGGGKLRLSDVEITDVSDSPEVATASRTSGKGRLRVDDSTKMSVDSLSRPISLLGLINLRYGIKIDPKLASGNNITDSAERVSWLIRNASDSGRMSALIKASAPTDSPLAKVTSLKLTAISPLQTIVSHSSYPTGQPTTMPSCGTGSFYDPSTGAGGGCGACPKGKYSDTIGQISCTNCPIGTYSDRAGSSACTVCPWPRSNLDLAQSGCPQYQLRLSATVLAIFVTAILLSLLPLCILYLLRDRSWRRKWEAHMPTLSFLLLADTVAQVIYLFTAKFYSLVLLAAFALSILLPSIVFFVKLGPSIRMEFRLWRKILFPLLISREVHWLSWEKNSPTIDNRRLSITPERNDDIPKTMAYFLILCVLYTLQRVTLLGHYTSNTLKGLVHFLWLIVGGVCYEAGMLSSLHLWTVWSCFWTNGGFERLYRMRMNSSSTSSSTRMRVFVPSAIDCFLPPDVEIKQILTKKALKDLTKELDDSSSVEEAMVHTSGLLFYQGIMFRIIFQSIPQLIFLASNNFKVYQANNNIVDFSIVMLLTSLYMLVMLLLCIVSFCVFLSSFPVKYDDRSIESGRMREDSTIYQKIRSIFNADLATLKLHHFEFEQKKNNDWNDGILSFLYIDENAKKRNVLREMLGKIFDHINHHDFATDILKSSGIYSRETFICGGLGEYVESKLPGVELNENGNNEKDGIGGVTYNSDKPIGSVIVKVQNFRKLLEDIHDKFPKSPGKKAFEVLVVETNKYSTLLLQSMVNQQNFLDARTRDRQIMEIDRKSLQQGMLRRSKSGNKSSD